jgi:hypothetical protein
MRLNAAKPALRMNAIKRALRMSAIKRALRMSAIRRPRAHAPRTPWKETQRSSTGTKSRSTTPV